MAALHLLVRWLHVLGVAVMLGGSVLTWGALRTTAGDSIDRRLAESYEWLFWGALGVVVLAGVGNLGALAPGVPGPETRWGTTLAVKLVVLLAFVVLSVVRSLAVVRARSDGAALHPNRLRTAYAATTAALLVLLALAEVLAHG